MNATHFVAGVIVFIGLGVLPAPAAAGLTYSFVKQTV